MKIIIASIVFASAICISCNNSSEKNKIIGKWTVDKASAVKNKNDSPGQADHSDSTLNKLYRGDTYDFKPNGTLTLTNAFGPLQYTWEMLKDEKNGNKELSGIKIKGDGWEDIWVPGVGESMFYMKDIDNALFVKLVKEVEANSVYYNLSKVK